MKTLYLDCPSGASGDMILAALLDCGLSPEVFKQKISLLPLQNYRITFSHMRKSGISCFHVEIESTTHQHERHLKEIEEIITSSSLPYTVKEKSLEVFNILAQAEARIHGVSPHEIHFHEVGAVDSIIDVVGTVLALEMLEIKQVYASSLPLGNGWITTKGHGFLPLPAPATVEIIKEYSIPCYGLSIQEETVTPTGAALLAGLCNEFSTLPSIVLEETGYGTGKKDFKFPNILRAFLGTLTQESSFSYSSSDEPLIRRPLEIIEANIDDLNPEIYDYLLESLFSCGALDVYFTPIQMKKNRPAIKVTIISEPQYSFQLGNILLRETTTLGYRRFSAEKLMLPREILFVETPWGNVRVKVAGELPHYQNISPEYKDCLDIARETGIPLKKVYQAVWKALYT